MNALSNAQGDPRFTDGGERIRIAVQERRRLYRDGLALLFGGERDFEVVGTAESPRELEVLWAESPSDCVVLEVDGAWDPCPVVARLRAIHATVRFVGLSEALEERRWWEVKRAGVDAVCDRAQGAGPLIDAVRGGPGCRREDHVRSVHREVAALTAREREVLQLIGCGATSFDASVRLGISAKTVENHKRRIFEKLGVQNQAHAVAVAMRRGLVQPDTRRMSQAAV